MLNVPLTAAGLGRAAHAVDRGRLDGLGQRRQAGAGEVELHGRQPGVAHGVEHPFDAVARERFGEDAELHGKRVLGLGS
jgi:hypothetical protein